MVEAPKINKNSLVSHVRDVGKIIWNVYNLSCGAANKIKMDVEQLIQLVQANPVPIAVAVLVIVATVLLALRGSPKPFLDPQQFKPLPLIRIDQLTHNTKRFVFGLPDPKMRIGLPTGQHITFLAKDSDGKDVYRSVLPAVS